MVYLLLTMLACLAVCAAIAVYVAYPARGRAMPDPRSAPSARRRPEAARVPVPRERSDETAQEARR